MKSYRVGNLKYNLAEFEIVISQHLVDIQDTDFTRLLTSIVLPVDEVSALWLNFFIHKIDIYLAPGYILKSSPCTYVAKKDPFA